MNYQCYVAYCKRDRTYMRALCRILKKTNKPKRSPDSVAICYSKEKSGYDAYANASQLIGSSHCVIAIISKKTVNDKFLNREIAYASMCKKRIIPLFVEPITVKGPLNLMLSQNSKTYFLEDRHIGEDLMECIRNYNILD